MSHRNTKDLYVASPTGHMSLSCKCNSLLVRGLSIGSGGQYKVVWLLTDHSFMPLNGQLVFPQWGPIARWIPDNFTILLEITLLSNEGKENGHGLYPLHYFTNAYPVPPPQMTFVHPLPMIPQHSLFSTQRRPLLSLIQLYVWEERTIWSLRETSTSVHWLKMK